MDLRMLLVMIVAILEAKVLMKYHVQGPPPPLSFNSVYVGTKSVYSGFVESTWGSRQG